MNKYATNDDVLNSNTDQLRNIISSYSSKCKSIIIITGFITKKGFTEFVESLDDSDIKKIKKIVVGVYTSSAQKAFEYISTNVKYSHIKLYLYNNSTLTRYNDNDNDVDEDKNIRFSPILHAKIIAGYEREIVWAYTGSANITDFAFNDKNIESGIFLNNNRLLKSIDLRIKKIFLKKNLLRFNELTNNTVCYPTKTNPDIFQIPILGEKNYKKIKNTYILFVKSYLNNRSTKIIGLYSKEFSALPENIFSLDNKIIIVFYDKVITPTIVTGAASKRDMLKDPSDINFYIHRKTELSGRGFYIEDSYLQSSENKIFVILEDKNNPKTHEEYKVDIEQLNKLFKVDIMENFLAEKNNLLIENDDYKKAVIIEPAKQRILLNDKKLKEGVFNMNDLDLTTIKNEITVFDLKSDDDRFNKPISLKIKTN